MTINLNILVEVVQSKEMLKIIWKATMSLLNSQEWAAQLLFKGET